jgi:hypothetical protein
MYDIQLIQFEPFVVIRPNFCELFNELNDFILRAIYIVVSLNEVEWKLVIELLLIILRQCGGVQIE